MQGVQTLQKQIASGSSKLTSKPLFIFLAPPSVAELEKRLKGRGTETDESLAKRLEAATREMEWGVKPGAVDHLITNNVPEVAYAELKKILNL
jgi:guanylate kinase